MTDGHSKAPQRRIYPLDNSELSQEQLAVVFAMTSRRPEAFDVIAAEVGVDKAAQFHERWVLNYGHASVAEHAILHVAVENISRLACDTLEDNRLASYTEKSSRYQILDANAFFEPEEIGSAETLPIYRMACQYLFDSYTRMVPKMIEQLPSILPKQDEESDGGYRLRLRRAAVDSCRFVLPASTLTNVGVTMNARSMEHAVTKLLSSDLQEERAIGEELLVQGRTITPTLIKYADYNNYIHGVRDTQNELDREYASASLVDLVSNDVEATLHHYDQDAPRKLAAAILYRYGTESYASIQDKVAQLTETAIQEIVDRYFEGLGPHDVPGRELEVVEYVFELVMDYGAYREFKRHRMQTYIPQQLTTNHGYIVPDLIDAVGLKSEFEHDMETAFEAESKLAGISNQVAQYVVTHAHLRRTLVKLNLRECFHLFKLRTQESAHFTIRRVAFAALGAVQEVHPGLFKHLQLRG